MNFRLFPVARLADHLSQHGFRVYGRSRLAIEEGNEFFVSQERRVVATVKEKFGKLATVTYGNRDAQLIAVAEQFGDVLALEEQPSPELRVGARDLTGELVAGWTLFITILVTLMCLGWLAGWWFGW